MRVAGQQQNLMRLGTRRQLGGDGGCPFRVEVHEHVVEHDRKRHRAFHERVGQAEAKAQIKLLDRPTAQAMGVDHLPARRQRTDRLAAVDASIGQQADVAAGGDPFEVSGRFGDHRRLPLALVLGERAM